MQLTTNHPSSSYNIPVFVDGGNNPLDYADGIKHFRKLNGFKTAADLAEKLGVSTRTVQGWEQGRMPSKIALKFMMELLER